MKRLILCIFTLTFLTSCANQEHVNETPKATDRTSQDEVYIKEMYDYNYLFAEITPTSIFYDGSHSFQIGEQYLIYLPYDSLDILKIHKDYYLKISLDEFMINLLGERLNQKGVESILCGGISGNDLIRSGNFKVVDISSFCPIESNCLDVSMIENILGVTSSSVFSYGFEDSLTIKEKFPYAITIDIIEEYINEQKIKYRQYVNYVKEIEEYNKNAVDGEYIEIEPSTITSFFKDCCYLRVKIENILVE